MNDRVVQACSFLSGATVKSGVRGLHGCSGDERPVLVVLVVIGPLAVDEGSAGG